MLTNLKLVIIERTTSVGSGVPMPGDTAVEQYVTVHAKLLTEAEYRSLQEKIAEQPTLKGIVSIDKIVEESDVAPEVLQALSVLAVGALSPMLTHIAQTAHRLGVQSEHAKHHPSGGGCAGCSGECAASGSCGCGKK